VTEPLEAFVAVELARGVPDAVAAGAARLAARGDARAVLFYGSVLRTGELDGVLDYYVLTDAVERGWLWPDVSYHEWPVGGRTLRAKVATMPLATFAAAAGGDRADTTIWTRFVQPAALTWARGEAEREAVTAAVAAAAATAARFAAVLGPARGPADDYWRALFRETYRAELRVETPGREAQILGHDPARWAALLPLAWDAGGVGYRHEGATLAPALPAAERRRLLARWRRRRRLGRPLNAARLVKASFTFDGAAAYALWKVERHTGVRVPLTPFRERHPVLAAPAVLWRVWRARRAT
jgi:hypothetical protein